MSWPAPLGDESPPSIEQILLRLAFHIRQRTSEAAVAETVLTRARITRRTLARYATWRPTELDAGGDLHAAGPRRLDLFAAICLALEEDPGRVLWAATVSGDYPTMLLMLDAEIEVRPQLRVHAGPGTLVDVRSLRRSA